VRRTIVPFFLPHRGCPHRCVFCDQRTVTGGDTGLPTPAAIAARVAAYRATSGGEPVEVAFFGGTFTGLPREEQESLLAPLQRLQVAGQVTVVRVSTRPDRVTGDTARFLRRLGVATVELGVQSLDDGVLARAGRGHTAAQVAAACQALRAAELAVGIQLMPGLPGDTPTTARASLGQALALGPDFLRIYPALVLAGTELATMYLQGRYQPLTLEAAVALCKVLLHDAERAGVPVVRLGLQPTAELSAPGTVLTGPYHPAFRQLVEGALSVDLLEVLLARCPGEGVVTVRCAPGQLSTVQGQHRQNLAQLRAGGIVVTRVAEDASLKVGELAVARGERQVWGSVLADLTYPSRG